MKKFIRTTVDVVEAVYFDSNKHPWPDGVYPWPDSTGFTPRDMSVGYVLSGERVLAGDYIVTDQ